MQVQVRHGPSHQPLGEQHIQVVSRRARASLMTYHPPSQPCPTTAPSQDVVAATVQLAGRALGALQHLPPTNWPRDYSGYSSRGRRYLPASSAFAGPEAWEGDGAQCSALLLHHFQQGDVYLNLNVPPSWKPGGQFSATGGMGPLSA